MSEQKPEYRPSFHIDHLQAQSEPDIQAHSAPLEVVPVEVNMLASLNGAPDTLRQAITSERHERAIEGAHSTKRILEEKEALREAEVDAVTGLPTRAVFEREFGARVRRSKDKRRSDEALLLVDVNQLKPVNDQFGHAEGDHLLHEVARLIKNETREGFDVLSRIGGDELGILLRDVRSISAMQAVIKHLKVTIDNGIHYDGIATGISVGGQIISKNMSAEDIYKAADEKLSADKNEFYEQHPEIVRRSSVVPVES
ncbi:hypothetical protein BH10PAT3_BH10PAT3_0400 [soil metagenome]